MRKKNLENYLESKNYFGMGILKISGKNR